MSPVVAELVVKIGPSHQRIKVAFINSTRLIRVTTQPFVNYRKSIYRISVLCKRMPGYQPGLWTKDPTRNLVRMATFGYSKGIQI